MNKTMQNKTMRKSAWIAALVLVSLAFTLSRVQAQTSPTNATTNSQLANANTANALGVTTGITTGVTTGAATSTTTNGQQQSGSQSPTTGVICLEEMTATFCNVPSGPNTDGYGSIGGSGSSSGSGSSGGSGSGGGSAAAAGSASSGAGANTSSIPACSGFPSPNELCN
jgi:hypothetical protein